MEKIMIAKSNRLSVVVLFILLMIMTFSVMLPAFGGEVSDDSEIIMPKMASDYFDQKLIISNVSCQNLECKATQGWSAYQGTVAIKGTIPTDTLQRRIVITVFSKTGKIEYRDNFPVMWNEDSSTSGLFKSIPAEILHNGDYTFKVTFMGSDEVITSGSFTIQRSGGSQKQSQAKSSTSSLVGTWWGIAQTTGTIELRSDGTYLHNGKKGGKYKVQGGQIAFTGGLSAWNGGYATLKDNVIEFHWTNSDGSINWFTFSK